LDSLVNQILKDIEIICINDCSTDKSLAILKSYMKKDERVKIIDFEKNNEYYPQININVSALQNRKIYVWGAGTDGFKVQMQCERNNWKISAFLDSRKDIKEFSGYKIKRPEQILNKAKKDFFIIISSRKYGKEIAKTCEHYGLKKNLDFWKP